VSAVNLVYIDLFEYSRIYLLAAIVKDSVSCQSSTDLFRYRWIHLLAAIVKEDSVSQRSGIDNSEFRISLDSPTCCNSKGGQRQPSI
jgi:hypothetical protein